MSKTILANVDGWTPCIDSITQTIGAIASIVFGRMWRYCQLSNRVCSASIDKVADELGLSYNTVHTHVIKLVEAGYLEDLDPGVRNRPHRYADTGKASLSISVTAGPQNLGTNPPENGRGPQNLMTRSSEIDDLGPQNLGMKRVFKKEIKKEEDKEPSVESDELPEETSIFRQIPGSSQTPAQAWKYILEMLRQEVPRSQYVQYIQSTQVIDYQPESDCFVIDAGSEPARSWLESRLTATLEKHLSGVCDGRPAEIQFVVLEKELA